MSQKSREPSLMFSLIPVVFLVSLLVINVTLFKDDATAGANQLALFLSAALAMALGIFFLKVEYKTIEKGIIQSISLAMQANIILLVVGALIGLWILSGIVPTMIYYGLKLIHPSVFLPVSCLVCAVVSLATGSSWSTSGTVGIALIGIGQALGIPLGMVAGAVISGSYFGDKMSPLSDTTNLASAMAGTELFTHIRHMFYTTIPAILVALTGFFILNFFYKGDVIDGQALETVLVTMQSKFFISPFNFVVPALVLLMVAKKTPALPALIVGTLLGGVWALLFQQEAIATFAGESTISSVYKTIIEVGYGGFKISSGNATIDSLFSRGGMSNMLSTVWLILMAMCFGGAMEATGMLPKIANSILKLVKGTGSLIGATIGSCLFLNMTASDQYLAIVVPGRMFKKAYDDYNLAPQNLSRALEDSGTVTSVLVPWNSGGAYHASILGVATLSYLPFCFFNLASPLISLFLASIGKTIVYKKKLNNQASS